MVSLGVKEGEPETVDEMDELKDVVRVPDPQALVVTEEVKEGEYDTVVVAE